MKNKKSLCVAFALFVSVQLFSATMQSRVRQIPKNLQEQVFIEPKDTLMDVTKALVSGISDASTKVKIIHDWICDNIAYDCNVFTDAGAGPQGFEAVLKKKKAVCAGYANLMAVMCGIVNIECEIVYGWSKGFNYPGYLWPESDHAWNAVKLGGRWKLIDVTWDAGFVEGTTFIKRYTNQWYNLTPDQFGYSHLPEEDKWQLLPEKQIRSHEQFEREPYVPGVFFEYGLSFGKNAPCYKNEISEAMSFDFSASKNTVMLYADMYGKSQSDMTNCVWMENAGRNKKCIFDVPDKASYTARVGARTEGVVNNPTYFLQGDFEQNVLPAARNLFAQKKITKNEIDFFERSYTLVAENRRYYYIEDLFDTQRNAANTKILKLLNKNTSRYENVITFEVHAAADYEGKGTTDIFPIMYRNYLSAANIRLESPLVHTLKKGTEYHFAVTTNAYNHMAFVLPENTFVFLTKNPKTGSFELDFTIPEDIQTLGVYASKDKKEFVTLFEYALK